MYIQLLPTECIPPKEGQVVVSWLIFYFCISFRKMGSVSIHFRSSRAHFIILVSLISRQKNYVLIPNSFCYRG